MYILADALPRTFNIFGYQMAFYSLFAFIAFLTSFIIANYRWRKRGYNPKELETFLFITLFTAIFGARFWYLLFSGRNILEIFNFTNMSGLAIQGGIIATFVAGYYYFNSKAKPKSTSYIRVIDCLVPIILIGHSIGRWGNFFNQEVYGGIVSQDSLWWLPTPIADNMYIEGFYRAPLFLYEQILNVTLFVVIILVVERIWKGVTGISGAAYLIGYGLIRMILENFRDQKDIITTFGIRTSVVTAILFILAGAWIFKTFSWPEIKERRKDKSDKKIKKVIEEEQLDEGEIRIK